MRAAIPWRFDQGPGKAPSSAPHMGAVAFSTASTEAGSVRAA